MTNTPTRQSAAGSLRRPLARPSGPARTRARTARAIRSARAGMAAAVLVLPVLLILSASAPAQAVAEPSTTPAPASAPAPMPARTDPAPATPVPVTVVQPPGISGYLPADDVPVLFIATLIAFLASRPGGREAVRALVAVWRDGGGAPPPA
ncbi:hypothetical protein [Streptomyces sp. ITFR-6]|uniref:hypothetical protein n=1 Tax=Streptomyces sp. ITFR-6 TaxID=3075197 RepID=UPI00288B396C|nr:hypothetical protein [Streptomyces sp. ITFR-6]WNI28286.1 hypothetical protein RLT59_05460 [Streptomyces sp. ITFR-6]